MSTHQNPTTIRIDPDVLAEALGLPKEVRIKWVRWDDVGPGTIEFELVAEGWPEAEICPVITEIPRQRIWKHGEIELGRREMRW